MSLEKFKPDEATTETIKAELVAYDAHRLGVHGRQRWWMGLALIPAGLVAVFGTLPLFGGGGPPLGAKDFMQYAFWVLIAVATLGAGGIWLATMPARNLQQSLRDRLLPRLFGFLGEVEYSHGSKPFTYDYVPKGALPDHIRAEFGDVIRGRYKWMRFELFELNLRTGGKGNKTVFDGVGVGFDITDAFPGVLIASPRASGFWIFLRDMFGSAFTTVEAGHPPLDAVYEFRSDRSGPARDLVTGTLGSALVDVSSRWREGAPRIALSGEVGFLLVPTTKDFFELPAVGVAADYERHIAPMIGELVALLDTALLVRRAMAGREGTEEEPGLLD